MFRNKHDLSVRFDGTNFIPNTLGDLTKRENRYGHDISPPGFPFPARQVEALTAGRQGDDVILTNVLAFDVKAYDPFVPMRVTTTNVATLPSDPGYGIGANTQAGSGGYVDLNYSRSIPPALANSAESFGSYFVRSGNAIYQAQPPVARLLLPTYDTWSLHYEQNGVDDNNLLGPDLATNGLDDNSNGVVDDLAESDAPPPYSVPLRGIQIKIRVYEPDSRQVREVTVVQDFLPQ